MPSTSSFFTLLSSVDSYNLNKYCIAYHPKTGFDLHRKHATSINILNRIIDPIIRAWNTSMGYSYAFEDNVAKLTQFIKKDWADITDVTSCIVSCRRLRKIGERVLEKRGKDSSALTEALTKSIFKLLSKKAEQEYISVFECACRYNLFKEARSLLAKDPEMLTISQESKNKLLGHFLDKRDTVMADKAIRAGANVRSQVHKLGPLIDKFSKQNISGSVLDPYFIVIKEGGFVALEMPRDGLDLANDVINPVVKHFYMYRGKSSILNHTVQKIAAYIEQSSPLIQDTKACAESLKKLMFKLGPRNSDLAELVQIASCSLLSKKAETEGISSLELALRLDLLLDAEYLAEMGADITTLSDESKTKLFGRFITTDFEICHKLLILGADPRPYKERLQPFLHYIINAKDQESAITLLDAGASCGPTDAAKGDNAFFRAVKNGLIKIVEKLVEMKEPLNQRFKNEKTALHIAAQSDRLEMVEWLSKRLDVAAVDSIGETAFCYIREKAFFTSKSSLEQAFLLGEVQKCRSILRGLGEQASCAAIADLRQKYPLSCVDHLLYSVKAAHFKNQELVALPAAVAPGSKVRELLMLFDEMNLTDAYGEHYVKQEEYLPDTQTANPRQLRSYLEKFVTNIEKRTAFIGTPRKGPSLDVFYSAMERAVTHTIQAIKDMPDSDEKITIRNRTLVQFMRASTYCGGKQYATACQQYVAVVRGEVPTFKDEILEILGNYREVLFQSLVPKGAQSVHDFNKMMHYLGKELGIPGAEMMDGFRDHYGKHILDYDTIKRQFFTLYSARNIIFESIKQSIEQSSDMRAKCFDWFKENVPESWKQSYFAQIRQHVEGLESPEEQVAYLETQDITVEEGQQIDEAIDEATEDDAAIAYRYLGLEVVVDMSSPQMKIKPSAIAYMLQKMGVLEPVYKWDYSLVNIGGIVLSGAWKGFKAILGSLFS